MDTKMGKRWYKLMNNVVYGKTKGNVKNRIDSILVSNKKNILNEHQN